MDACSRREYCRMEISQKLKNWGAGPAISEKVLKELVHQKFIDHSRFTRAFVNDKLLFNHWGKVKLKFHLYHFQIEKEIVEEALQQIDESVYLSIIKAEIQKKQKSALSGNSFEVNQKIAKAIINKGFEPNLVFKLLKIDSGTAVCDED